MELTLALPPTDNNTYLNLPMHGRVLTKDAKRYKLLVKESAARIAVTNKLNFREHIPYTVRVNLFMDMYTKGWPKNAKWKFRRVDATNRTKLILDAISKAVGVDDRHFVDVRVRKEHTDGRQYVKLILEEMWSR